MIVPNERTTRYRKAMYALAWGELGVSIGQAYVFGLLMGMFHLIVIWINYTNYATMNYCGSLIVAICGAMELIMLFMNANDDS